MRYIGGKRLMIDNIMEAIKENTVDVKTVMDPFCGSGAVTSAFKSNGYKTISNDLMYFSYVLQRGTVCINNKLKFLNLNIQNPIEYLNNLKLEDTDIRIEDCFIYNNYSPNDNCERMYFQNENAIKIDIIRITIEDWKKDNLINEDEYFYLLASLLNAVPYVSNIAGVYGAYLKHWDKRTYNPLILKEPEIISSRYKHLALNEDANKIIGEYKVDLVYLDTPYNERQYLPNYHVLETIAKYDNPQIKGVTGMRDYSSQKSDYCLKSKVYNAYFDFLSHINARYILISYNNEGLLSTKEMTELLKRFGKKNTFRLYEYDYRRYKSKIPNNKKGLKEQLYFIELYSKEDFIKSPMNYIGGKYKLLPQIYKYFPSHIETFVDLFCGGLDVSINIKADNIISNDINSIMIDMYKEMQKMNISELLDYIDGTIAEYQLSKTNKDGYLKLREHYNSTRNPIDLFVLICYSFNHQIRFNSNLQFNSPFGENRSAFNDDIRSNLINFHERIKNVHFISESFSDMDLSFLGENDFVYVDPPYLISCGSYNDGKRGFEGWTEEHDRKLFAMLDELNERNVKFALSNVVEHKGTTNDGLVEWMKNYNVHYLSMNYKNCNYQCKDKNKETIEVLVTNY